jgi:hypothetical protein
MGAEGIKLRPVGCPGSAIVRDFAGEPGGRASFPFGLELHKKVRLSWPQQDPALLSITPLRLDDVLDLCLVRTLGGGANR